MSPSTPAAAPSPAREALTDAALLAVDTLLLTGAALRVTRFATTDVLGGWVLSDPLHRLAERLEPATPPHPFGYLAPPSAPLHRLVSALDCPFCVGTQAALVIGAALAATSSPARRRSRPGRLIRSACAALSAAYVVGHVSHRIDTTGTTGTTGTTAPASPATKDSK